MIQRVAVIFDNTLRRETTGVYCRRALGELVEVEHFLPSELERIPRERFDLLLNVDDGLDYELPGHLRPAAFWAIDTHIEFERSLKKSRQCDFVFAAQKDGAARLRREGISNAVWLPLACDPQLHGKQVVEKQYDVGFVGNVFPGPRAELLNRIRAEFPNTFIGQRYFEEMAAVYSQSQIVFNRGILNDVNMRVFEALCSGSLLLTNDLADNGQAELFQDGIHLATYGDEEELLDKIRWYLTHEREREHIGSAGQAEVLARHTYRHRMQTMLEAVEQRIKQSSRNGNGTFRPKKDVNYFEFARPEVLALVPRAARRVLDIGCGAGRLGLSIKERQQAEVIGLELDRHAAEVARTRLDNVVIGNAEDESIDFPFQSLDCVICADVLEHMRSPRPVLKKIARWLAPEGRLVASIPNVRHHTVIQSLLDGNFTYEPAGLLDEDHVHLFTRREIEKLFFRAGFAIERLQIVPGPGHQEWLDRGRPGEVAAGRLRVGGLTPQDAEDFYAYQFLVSARPAVGAAIQDSENGRKKQDVSAIDQSEKIRALAELHPWPETKPRVSIPEKHIGWMADGARLQLIDAVNGDTRLVVELGAWLGLSTRFIADRAPNATVISIDHWEGSIEHHIKAEWQALLPMLYESFLAMCWDYRERILPLKMTVQEGLARIAETGLSPDVIYFDAEHSYAAVTEDLDACRRLFPEAVLIGDDYDDPGVGRAVREFAEREGLHVETKGEGWHGWRLRDLQSPELTIPDAPADWGLTSIILVTHNQLSYTHACLESIRFVTDEPYELIVVDNGSADGSVDFLRSQAELTLIENPDNRGFPAAANQGIQAARGANILLLNNDTIVTTGWLRRMLSALQSDETIGLVGPCSNSVSGPQQVPASYTDLSGLDGFAWEWGKQHDRQKTEADRLVGFCLLFKRAVVETIGLLDEQFGIGNFEDDDYCRRALEAGYRCVIAHDAFIHHFGGTTFRASGVDFASLMAENQRKYEQKWERESARPESAITTKGNRRAATAPTSVRPNQNTSDLAVRIAPGGGLLLERKPSHAQPDGNRALFAKSGIRNTKSAMGGSSLRLSLCMIVRDNEDTIRPCLESIRPWVDEMIVVDTGSKDATPKIAAELGARVYEFPWCDDFSAARNESLKYARGEWIFWMDSDDTTPSDCGRQLRDLADGSHPDIILGYVMQVHCPGSGEDGEHDFTAVDHVKLFRNRPDLRFDFRIHEQILPAIRRAGGEVAFTDIYVVHSGSDQSESGRAGKYERDFRILAKDLAERPDHPFVLFNLGMTYADAQRHDEAISHLKRCLEVSSAGDSHVRKAYAFLVSSLSQAERHEEAWHVCENGRTLFPDDSELLFRAGLVNQHLGRRQEAVQVYLEALRGPQERHFSSMDVGINGYKTRHNLAIVYEEMGEYSNAEAQWRAIIVEQPDYRQAYRALAELLFKQGRVDDVERLIGERLRDVGSDNGALVCEAWVLRARVAEARGAFDDAIGLFEVSAKRFASDPEPLRQLCRCLFERKGPAGAKTALLRLARREHRDPATLHNLGTAYLFSHQPHKAVAAFRQSLRLRDASAQTHLHLGFALRDCNRTDEAVTAWQAALRLDPQNQAAREALETTGVDSEATRA